MYLGRFCSFKSGSVILPSLQSLEWHSVFSTFIHYFPFKELSSNHLYKWPHIESRQMFYRSLMSIPRLNVSQTTLLFQKCEHRPSFFAVSRATFLFFYIYPFQSISSGERERDAALKVRPRPDFRCRQWQKFLKYGTISLKQFYLMENLCTWGHCQSFHILFVAGPYWAIAHLF